MGSNWKEYLTEGKRVLRYNGEMIISESVERFNIVKEYLETLSFSSKEKDKITSECETFWWNRIRNEYN